MTTRPTPYFTVPKFNIMSLAPNSNRFAKLERDEELSRNTKNERQDVIQYKHRTCYDNGEYVSLIIDTLLIH